MADLSGIGIGAAPLGNLYRPVSDEEAAATLAAAFAAGFDYVDTAPYYGFGLSETRVGGAIADLPDIRVSTKVGRVLVPDPAVQGTALRHGYASPLPFRPEYDYSHDGILRSCEASLARLGRSRVDALFIHDIGALTHGATNAQHLEALERGGFRALERLKAEGVAGAIGIGVNEVEACLDLMDRIQLDMVLLAGRYTLIEQTPIDRLFPRCMAEGIAVVIGGPYNSGILATGTGGARPCYDYAPAPGATIDKVRRIETVCARHGVPLAAAALAFAGAHPAVVSVIPGLASVKEVRATAAWAALPIPAELWAELRAEGLLRVDAPTPETAPA